MQNLNEEEKQAIKTEQENTENQSQENIQEKEVIVVEKLEAEKKELQDKYLRLVAEFENYKKRNAKERIELIQTAGKEIIISMLEILDDSERAIKQFEKEVDIKQIREGAGLIFGKLKNNLQSKGLKKMESMGQVFDIEKHEAITEMESTEANKGMVIDVVQDGYFLNDKLIRFAKVVVGK